MAGLEVGVISRSQDFSIIRHNEDVKPMTDQAVIGEEVQKQNTAKSEEVTDSQEADWYDKRHDASEKGSNEYSGDGGAKRGKKDTGAQAHPDRVIVKGQGGSGSFNVTV